MKIKIGYKTYQVKKIAMALCEGDSLGAVDHKKGEIYISQGLVGPDYVETLLHEVGHCICDVWGIGDSSDSEKTIDISEEDMVRRTYSGLTTVFVDNRWLLKHIMDAL